MQAEERLILTHPVHSHHHHHHHHHHQPGIPYETYMSKKIEIFSAFQLLTCNLADYAEKHPHLLPYPTEEDCASTLSDLSLSGEPLYSRGIIRSSDGYEVPAAADYSHPREIDAEYSYPSPPTYMESPHYSYSDISPGASSPLEGSESGSASGYDEQPLDLTTRKTSILNCHEDNSKKKSNLSQDKFSFGIFFLQRQPRVNMPG